MEIMELPASVLSYLPWEGDLAIDRRECSEMLAPGLQHAFAKLTTYDTELFHRTVNLALASPNILFGRWRGPLPGADTIYRSGPGKWLAHGHATHRTSI